MEIPIGTVTTTKIKDGLAGIKIMAEPELGADTVQRTILMPEAQSRVSSRLTFERKMKMKKFIIGSVVMLIAVGGIAFAYQQSREPKIPQTFEELIQLSDEEIENFDIGRMNLLCAKGLPGSEDLDIESCIQKLDQWAQHVKMKEQQSLPAFFKYREKYQNSIALFKGAYLGFAIQDDFKCDYNMGLYESGIMEDRTSTRFFYDSSDLFINGLITEQKGTCSSMPVLMVVLGRRCDYPLYLVQCGGHMFSRWDD